MKSNITLPQIKQKTKRTTFFAHKNAQQNTVSSTQITRKDDIVKSFEQKLQSHKLEIEKNNEIINQLTENFDILKNELIKQKKLNDQLQTNAKKLKQQIQKSNKAMRLQKQKYDEIEKMYNKQVQQHKNTAKLIQIKEKQMNQLAITEQKKYKNLQAQLSMTSRKVSVLEKEIQNLNKSLKSKQEVENKQKDNTADFIKQIELLKSQKYQLKHLIEQLQYDIHKLKIDKEESSITIKNLKQLHRDKQQNINNKIKKQKLTLEHENQELQTQISRLKNQLRSMNQNLKKIEKENELKLTQLKKQSQDKYRKYGEEITKINQKHKSEISSLKQESTKAKLKLNALDDIKKLQQKLIQAEKSIQNTLKCTFCSELLKQPVTIIPCGHCFCIGCKKGYQKQCSKCGPKVKIDALYRNELMDDCLNVFKIIQSLSTLIAKN